MRTVRIFISYARADAEQAMYVRSLLDGASAFAAPMGLMERLATARESVKSLFAWGAEASDADAAHMAAQVGVTLRVWMEEESRSGDWGQVAQRAIESSGCFVVLAPERQSTFVAHECAIALGAGVPIVPITRSPGDLNGCRLGGYQALKWPRTDGRTSERWKARWSETLLHAVRESVAGRPLGRMS